MSESGVIALDIGTSSTKVCFINILGEVKAFYQINYKYETNKSGFYEQDPMIWWDAVCLCIKKVIKDIPKNLIKSISITGQYPSIFPVDRFYNPLRKAILWLDSRAESQALKIKEGIGVNIGAAWPVPKIMWLMDNEPFLHDQAFKYLQVLDFIRLKLSGECVTDWTSAWALGYESSRNSFNWEIMDFAGISANLLPKVLDPMEICGYLSEKASKETNLAPGTPIITGGNDISMAAFGSNVYNENSIFDVTGSSTFIGKIINKRINDVPFGLFETNGVLRNSYMLGCVINSTGSILEWLRNNIFLLENDCSKIQRAEFYKIINQKFLYKEISITDPLMIPYFTGMLSPHVDNKVRGAIHNLSFHNNCFDIVKSVFESTAFALKWNLEYIKKVSPDIERIIVSGGGSKSDVWCQMKADITGIAVTRMKYIDSSLLGAAMLAAIGVGMFSNINCCSKSFFNIERNFVPAKKNTEIISDRYNQFKELLSNNCHFI